MAGAVEAGLGAGMLLCLLADARPALVQLAPASPALDTEVWILSHPDLRRVMRIRTFVDFLASRLSQHPALAY
jgi:DNA-binding transcriptional LysR family regulator